MEIKSWEDMKTKYPENREDMTGERLKEFVNDCFFCYEQEGFAKKFWSPFGDYKKREGQCFEVVGRCTEEQTDISALPMWNIKFEDGTVIGAYPGEIIVREMKDNGCQMEGIEYGKEDKIMNFKEFLEKLNNGETVEQITKGNNVECIGNAVYEDDDLYDFMCEIGAEIEVFNVGYAVISTNDGKYYEVPYENRENRFGEDLPDETILFFEVDRIYDVTDSYCDK